MSDKPANDGDYKVGYGRPPRHSQFQPGQSGHPTGRQKGTRNLATDVKRALKRPVSFIENGKRRQASTQEAVILKLREKALKGDARALDTVMGYAARYSDDPPPQAPDQALSKDDEAIVAAFLAQNTTASGGKGSSAASDIEAEPGNEEPVPENDPDVDKPPD